MSEKRSRVHAGGELNRVHAWIGAIVYPAFFRSYAGVMAGLL